MDKRGRIEVDDQFRTNVKSILAIGDVIPGPMLAHKVCTESSCTFWPLLRWPLPVQVEKGLLDIVWGLGPAVLLTEHFDHCRCRLMLGKVSM